MRQLFLFAGTIIIGIMPWIYGMEGTLEVGRQQKSAEAGCFWRDNPGFMDDFLTQMLQKNLLREHYMKSMFDSQELCSYSCPFHTRIEYGGKLISLSEDDRDILKRIVCLVDTRLEGSKDGEFSLKALKYGLFIALNYYWRFNKNVTAGLKMSDLITLSQEERQELTKFNNDHRRWRIGLDDIFVRLSSDFFLNNNEDIWDAVPLSGIMYLERQDGNGTIEEFFGDQKRKIAVVAKESCTENKLGEYFADLDKRVSALSPFHSLCCKLEMTPQNEKRRAEFLANAWKKNDYKAVLRWKLSGVFSSETRVDWGEVCKKMPCFLSLFVNEVDDCELINLVVNPDFQNKREQQVIMRDLVRRTSGNCLYSTMVEKMIEIIGESEQELSAFAIDALVENWASLAKTINNGKWRYEITLPSDTASKVITRYPALTPSILENVGICGMFNILGNKDLAEETVSKVRTALVNAFEKESAGRGQVIKKVLNFYEWRAEMRPEELQLIENNLKEVNDLIPMDIILHPNIPQSLAELYLAQKNEPFRGYKAWRDCVLGLSCLWRETSTKKTGYSWPDLDRKYTSLIEPEKIGPHHIISRLELLVEYIRGVGAKSVDFDLDCWNSFKDNQQLKERQKLEIEYVSPCPNLPTPLLLKAYAATHRWNVIKDLGNARAEDIGTLDLETIEYVKQQARKSCDYGLRSFYAQYPIPVDQTMKILTGNNKFFDNGDA